MKLVEWFGEVWRLTDRNYAKLLKMVENDEEFDMNQLGKSIGVLDSDTRDLEHRRDETE